LVGADYLGLEGDHHSYTVAQGTGQPTKKGIVSKQASNKNRPRKKTRSYG
jgi:hypothetical protein